MELRFVPPSLRRLDELKSEALCLAFFEDERPLRGAAGLVDWRLLGAISRLLVRGRVRGAAGEKVLMPGGSRLSFDKLLLFGLGPIEELDEARFVAVIDSILSTLDELRARDFALALPGRAQGVIEPERAMELFLRHALSHREHDRVVLIEEAGAERRMQPVIERERRRARALSALPTPPGGISSGASSAIAEAGPEDVGEAATEWPTS